MPRARSKSPARRRKASAAAAGGFDVNDANVQLGLTVVALAACSFYANGAPTSPADFVGDFFNTLASDFSVNGWPFGGMFLAGHVMNCSQGAAKGFWAGSLMNAAFSAFGSVIVLDILNGRAQSLLADETALTLVLFCWYFANHDIPFTGFNVWTTLSGAAGAWLQNVLDVCSLCFVTNQVLAAAGSASAAGPLGFSVFTPLAMAGAAGAASEFFPLNKGINLKSCSAQLYSALCIGGFVVFMPMVLASPVGAALGAVYNPLSGLVNGHVVLASVVLNSLFGGFLNGFNPVGSVTGFLGKVTGV